jgi:fumarate reductase flavoprotein subunit
MDKEMERDYDVIVIGGGGAGLSAAVAAADCGARVALIEAGTRLGGSTALAGGYFYAVGTDQQHLKGVIDSVDGMKADIRAINGDTIPASVLDSFAGECAQALAWLGEIGVNFPAERLVSADGRMKPRSHEPEGFGAAIIERLDFEVSRRSVDVVLNTRVTELSVDERGRPNGVIVDKQIISAGSVVLACGGIGGSPELLDRMCPKSVRVGDWRWHVGCETNRGDGFRMAESVNAVIKGADSGLFLMTPNFYRDLEVIGPGWVLLVNSAGERFVCEDGAYWELSEALEAQSDARGYCLFTRDQMLAAKPDPRVLEALASGTITLSWVPKVLEEQIAAGRVMQADALEDLAELIGVDAEALGSTVARYNELALQGEDADYGKSAANLSVLARPPFFAVEVRPAIAIVTGAGPAIDERCRVLATDGAAVPGLYAAGEVTGNVYGRYYVGSGYAIATAISFGRVAGREAARFARLDN